MKKLVAECIGTFTLVFIGCGTAATVGCNPALGSGYILTAFAFGLALIAMAYSIGNISGCHINPAVSFAMLVRGKMTGKEFCEYVLAQCVGAVIGACLLSLFVPVTGGLGTNGLYLDNVCLSIVMEVILTFIFVMAVCGATDKREFSGTAGLIIGLSLVAVHILGIEYTGTSVNPARSLGPALFVCGKALENVWVFIIAPLIGGGLAGLTYKWLTK